MFFIIECQHVTELKRRMILNFHGVKMNWLILFFAFVSNAHAANPMNGGYVYECTKGGISSIMSMDLYEAEALRGVVYSVTAADEYKAVEAAIGKLKTLDSGRAAQFLEDLTNFKKEVVFVPDAQIIPLPDTVLVVTPNNCALKQLATIQDPHFTFDPRYVISQDLWSQMAVKERAAAILHLITLREGRGVGNRDSVGTRYLSTLMFSDKLKLFSLPDYIKLLEQIPLKTFSWNGTELCLKDSSNRPYPITYFPGNTKIQKAYACGEYTFQNGSVVDVNGFIVFDQAGGLLSAQSASSENWIWNWTLNGKNYSNVLSVEKMKFYPNGVLKTASVSNASPVKTDLHDIILAGELAFDTRGELMNGYVYSGSVTQPGTNIKLEMDEGLATFYPDGTLKVGDLKTPVSFEYFGVTLNIGNYQGATYTKFHSNGELQTAYVESASQNVNFNNKMTSLNKMFIKINASGKLTNVSTEPIN